MLYKLKSICIIFVIAGVIGIAVNTIFGYGTVEWFSRYRVGNVWLYRWDTSGYIMNLESSVNDFSKLALRLPERQWMEIDATIFEGAFWEALGNNLALMLDYMIMLINITVYPMRIGGYAIKQVLAVVGVNMITPNTESGIYWLVVLCNTLVEFQLPYI